MSDLVRESASDEGFVTSVRRGLDGIELSRRLRSAAELLVVAVIIAVAGNAALLSVREVVGVLGSSWDEAIASEAGLVASVAVALMISAAAREILSQFAELKRPR